MTPALALVFFISGLLALVSVLQNAPLFARGLQVTGIGGLTTVPFRRANFEHGPYLLQTAVGFVNADMLSYATTEAPDEVASPETFLARSEMAVDLLEQSLALDPASGMAWTHYAQALLNAGRIDAARDALVTAREMGPHQYYLAYRRLFVLEGIHFVLTTQTEAGQLTQAEIAASAKDLEIVRTTSPRGGSYPAPVWLED